MYEETKVDRQYIKNLVAETSFNETLLSKDYYLTRILYLLKDVKDIYFKGGTALQKIFLDYSRLSEDLDFTVTADVREKEREIKSLLKQEKFISKISHDKSVHKFVRMVIHYNNFSEEEDTIFIDLNERGKLLTKSEKHKIKHFYPDIHEFSISTLSKRELFAEKVAASIGRNKPRDHFDIYQIIKRKIPLDLNLAKEKCKQEGNEFDIVRMFKRANKLKNRWDKDMIPLLSEEVSFKTVMQTLAKYFNLKKEKKKDK